MLLVPRTASTLCATGMLLCDLQHDFVRSCIGPLEPASADRIRALVAELAGEGERQLRAEGAAQIEHQVSLDLRYLKQYHEVTVPVARDAVERSAIEGIAAAFHGEHNRLYGYDLRAEGTGLELINVRVRSLGRTARLSLPRSPAAAPDPGGALKGRRKAFVPESGTFAEVPVYDGHRLQSGNAIAGPALVDRTDTTIFITAGYAARVDEYGSMVLQSRDREGRHG
jgi:N-methylhydantoinase A